MLITYTHIDIITNTHLSYSFFHLKQNNLKKKEWKNAEEKNRLLNSKLQSNCEVNNLTEN